MDDEQARWEMKDLPPAAAAEWAAERRALERLGTLAAAVEARDQPE